MKTSKKMYSEAFRDYEIDEVKHEKLHQTLLKIMTDIKTVCDRHDIDYMMSGGTLLGTIRHQGFIPWDDDLDVMMLRSEYEKFHDAFLKDFAGKYTISEILSSDRYVNKNPKIYMEGTRYVEVSAAGVNPDSQIFVDIFVIENCPRPGFKRKLRAKVHDFAYKASSLCADYKFPSPVILEKSKTNKELAKYYSGRRRLGFWFAHLGGMKFYLKIVRKLENYKKKTGWLCVPSAITYEREVFEERVFTELTTGTFCGLEVKIPKYYDEYLRNLYKNYMDIPPVDKREIHCAYVLEFAE